VAERGGRGAGSDLLGVPAAPGRQDASTRAVGRTVLGVRAVLVQPLHVPQVQRAGPPVRAHMLVHAARQHRHTAQRPQAYQDRVRHEADHRPAQRRVHGYHRRIR